jgi:type IX secretion system substrate protein
MCYPKFILQKCVSAVVITIFLTFGLNKNCTAGNQTFLAGSCIIDMGIVPQTVSNCLKPYGLVHDLLKVHKIKVYWVINPTKSDDGIDFSYNGYDYKGGPFIIDFTDRTAEIDSTISYWKDSLGVVVNTTTGAVTVPVYTALQYYPRVLVDTLSGNQWIIEGYFDNAGIDSTRYTLGTPADATTCFDVWVNPHGDPTWATHSPLYDFVTYHKSFIWSQCHAVSMLEDVLEPVSPFRQLNYLSTTGLKCWKSTGQNGGCGGPPFMEGHAKTSTSPYTHYYPADPVRQFMGKAQAALNSQGSEKWFMPLTNGAWRGTTKRLITTSDGTSPGEGILMAYGPAFGDPANGKVMYASGHNHQGGTNTAHNIAAQRAFHNFMLLAGKERSIIQTSSIDAVMTGLNWYGFSVTISGGYPPYTFNWTSSIGGTFTQPDSASTAFIPPNLSTPTQGVITCTVTDSCSRVMAVTQVFTLTPSPLPVTLTEFTAEPLGFNQVEAHWRTESEVNNKFFTVSRSKNGIAYSHVGNIPSKGNGAIVREYQLIDFNPLEGKSLYRLSQTDANGDTEYFNPVWVDRSYISASANTTVIPNPFSNQINIQYHSETDGTVTVSLHNILGKVLSKSEYVIEKGISNIKLNDLQSFPKGNYLIRLIDDSGTANIFKLIK